MISHLYSSIGVRLVFLLVLGITPVSFAEAFTGINPLAVNSSYHFSLAESLFNQEDETYQASLEQSLYHYARSAVSEYTPDRAFYQLGRVNYVLGDTEVAVQNFEQQYERFGSKIPNVHYMLGLTYGDWGRQTQDEAMLQEAESQFYTFLDYMPEGVWAWTDLAWVKYWQEDYEGMHEVALAGREYHPDHPWLLNMQGMAHLNMDEFTEAAELLQTAQDQAQLLTVDDWSNAYTENDPAEYAKGLADFRKAIAYNLSLAQAEGNQELVKVPDLDIFKRELVAQGRGIAIPACGHSSPPTVTVHARVKPESTWYPTGGFGGDRTVYIKPDDDLVIRWSSTDATSCTNNFGGPNSPSGTHDVTPGLNPGESTTYQVSCTGEGGSGSGSVAVEVPEILVDSFIGNPWVVRNGETTELEWKLELSDSLSVTDDGDLTPYSYGCEIQGATADGSPHAFDASDNGGEGSITTRRLTSKFLNTLSCDTYVYEETEIEVVPDVQEI